MIGSRWHLTYVSVPFGLPFLLPSPLHLSLSRSLISLSFDHYEYVWMTVALLPSLEIISLWAFSCSCFIFIANTSAQYLSLLCWRMDKELDLPHPTPPLYIQNVLPIAQVPAVWCLLDTLPGLLAGPAFKAYFKEIKRRGEYGRRTGLSGLTDVLIPFFSFLTFLSENHKLFPSASIRRLTTAWSPSSRRDNTPPMHMLPSPHIIKNKN